MANLSDFVRVQGFANPQVNALCAPKFGLGELDELVHLGVGSVGDPSPFGVELFRVEMSSTKSFL